MMLTLSFHGELIAVRRGEITLLQVGGDGEQRASTGKIGAGTATQSG